MHFRAMPHVMPHVTRMCRVSVACGDAGHTGLPLENADALELGLKSVPGDGRHALAITRYHTFGLLFLSFKLQVPCRTSMVALI